jgi:hypothetical protein
LGEESVTLTEIIIAVSIHLLVPLAGLWCYVWLCQKMKKEKIPSPPYVIYFILFVTLGGWLMVALTLSLWRYSGMMLIGGLYLVFVAPVITGAMAFGLRSEQVQSIYHRRAFSISRAYSITLVVAVVMWFSFLLVFGKK